VSDELVSNDRAKAGALGRQTEWQLGRLIPLKRSDHIKFAKFVAQWTYYQEMERLGMQRDSMKDLLATIASEWIGKNIGVLPDMLEPGTDQYHRGIFHSKDVLNKIDKWKEDIRSRPSKNWQVDVFLLMALSAYQSHIILDSTTPMSVPDYQWVWKLLEAFKSK